MQSNNSVAQTTPNPQYSTKALEIPTVSCQLIPEKHLLPTPYSLLGVPYLSVLRSDKILYPLGTPLQQRPSTAAQKQKHKAARVFGN
eukprot:scaffold846_cov252-Pinguiococcus_pyrenoidosus.AAC.27